MSSAEQAASGAGAVAGALLAFIAQLTRHKLAMVTSASGVFVALPPAAAFLGHGSAAG